MDCIINAAWGHWYPKGQRRLVESLNNVCFKGDVLTWSNQNINKYFDVKQPYTIKLGAWHEALQGGYNNILWLDCSAWAIRSPDKIFKIIENEGGYFFDSGFKLGQCATDSDLDFAGWDRDDAMELEMICSGVFGLNMNDKRSHDFLEWFFEAKNYGVFGTSRIHNNGSQDPRYLFGRQDQTAATIAFHKAGFTKIYDIDSHLSFNENENENTIFKLKGM